jgi:uncharacterized cupin superfamily protein
VSWYVRNLRDAKWWDYGPAGFATMLIDDDDPQVGVNLFVLGPGQPMAMYHWEADQEGFLVLSGEALLIVEDKERRLRQWDYFHCPPTVPHTIVGAGNGPAAILAIGARGESLGEDWGAYPYSAVAMGHDASAEKDTTEQEVAYVRFPRRVDGEFREDGLPS